MTNALKWTTVSRCNPSTLWAIEELDRPGNGARFVRYIAEKLTTRDVTAYFKRNPLS